MTVGELKAAGADVGLTPEAIDAAVEKQAAEKVQARQRRERRVTWAFRSVMALCAVTVVSAAVSLWNAGTLDSDAQVIASKAAAVREAQARQEGTRAQMEGQPPSSTRDAELSGARNRVSIAIRRYNAAVATYNADSDCWLMFRSYRAHPARYPFWQEVSR
jgi:hypothetical protein